jgi:hypothetical protein
MQQVGRSGGAVQLSEFGMSSRLSAVLAEDFSGILQSVQANTADVK